MLKLSKRIWLNKKFNNFLANRQLCSNKLSSDFIINEELTKDSQKSNQSAVRVRFAPSPTGYLHLGGLRTALYNYLFVKANNGKFILRIEDTDQSRLVDGATEQLCTDLEWAGICPDEGPFQGGSFGPYVQSERLDIYRKEVKNLLENGTAYYCFCTERRLELLRKEALKARQVPKYDNRCRHLTPVQIAEKLANHDTFCIRFKLDPFADDYNDLIYGKMVYDVSANEGDPVIIKSDGYPTYHFANVVDDHFMQISHVLRGVEWQISTTKHLLLYKAFNWVPPKYGHLPLLLNSDGTKLSKRQGNINIKHYRSMGVRPQALINFITQSGGGFDRQPLQQQKQKNYSMEELQKMFDITKINAHSSQLNPDLLDECNRLDLLQQLNDPKRCNHLIQETKDIITTKYAANAHNLDLDPEHIKNVLKWAITYRISKLSQLIEENLSFLWVLPKETKKVEHDLKLDTINNLIELLEMQQDFNKINLQNILKEFSAKQDLKFNNFMKSLRTILSGLEEGPGIAEMMELLGKDTTIKRIKLKKPKK